MDETLHPWNQDNDVDLNELDRVIRNLISRG